MRRQPRPGLSLTEVLVAMFVMALGLMALLTLFPLGALQIGQALKDDRTAQVAQYGDAWVRLWWRDVFPGGQNVPVDGAVCALDDGNVADAGRNPDQNAPTVTTTYPYYQAPGTSLTSALLLPARTSMGTPNTLGAGPGNPFTTESVSLFGSETIRNMVPPDNPAAFTAPAALKRHITNPGLFDPNGHLRFETGTPVPSYPVLLDPLGFTATRSGTGVYQRFWAGVGNIYGAQPLSSGSTTPLLLARRSPAALATPDGRLRCLRRSPTT